MREHNLPALTNIKKTAIVSVFIAVLAVGMLIATPLSAVGATDAPLTPSSTTDEINITVNDSKNGQATANVSINIGTTKPGPIPGLSNAPTDPDGDKLYEDVNGDGKVNFDDAVELAFATGLTQTQKSAFDFDGDTDVDFDDATELAFDPLI